MALHLYNLCGHVQFKINIYLWTFIFYDTSSMPYIGVFNIVWFDAFCFSEVSYLISLKLDHHL